ncbi:hypothetical protein K2X14_15145 [Acetobacter sp. TBRC 12305]|uniref:Uncharacterized protein n=1 Tax=Acetobacter garciniae TaxID=2817435 RepID=A0A939KNL3_9PROT|nr:hypothetical protein [Acetobacter garciniae]MBO1326513.1 hypothetical protein [Acetobacter garciniae]MBX0346171.1 hypothetical protein [Acetobacter garciniae]
MRHSSRNEDDTVIFPAPARGMPKTRRVRPGVVVAGLGAAALLAGGGVALWRGMAPPRYRPPVQTEAGIDISAACMTHVGLLAQDHDILVIDFSSLLAQGQTLNRVAAFVEKTGLPRDRVLDDTALVRAIHESGATEQTYYYGHDYQAADLRRFFTQAARQSVPLNPQETWLHRMLGRMGWLQPDATGALITFSASGETLDATMRAVTLRHEIAHGAFYTVPAYRVYTEQFWQALPAPERAAFITFLGQQGYDTTDEALMFNEMQAYLAFTPDSRFFNAQVVGLSDRRLEAMRASFLNGMPDFWLRDLASQPLPPASVSTCPDTRASDPA